MAASPPQRPLRVALLGAGAVGTAVAATLKSKGHAITAVWSRTPSSAERAAARLGAVRHDAPAHAVEDATLVLIGASDAAIAPVADAAAPGLAPGAVVVHLAGSLGLDILAGAAGSGALVAALHPVQALPDVDTAVDRLPGSAWGVTCGSELEAWAKALVEELDGAPVMVAEKDRALWHAAAAVTSNGIAALLSTGTAILDRIGVVGPEAVLGPLAAGTVANVRARGASGDAFTGPVVRGDAATIARHLASLKDRLPELLDEYVLATKTVVAGAARSGKIDGASAASMRTLLERS